MKLPLNFQIFSPCGLKISFREKGFLVKHRLVPLLLARVAADLFCGMADILHKDCW